MSARGTWHRTALRCATAMAVVLLAGALGLAAFADDAPSCDGEAATLVGTPDDDELRGTPGPDVIVAGDGNDTVRALGGDDVVCGGEGADVLDGGDGADRLQGGRDERNALDTDLWEWRGDILVGGPGDDVLDAGADGAADDTRGLADTLSYAGSTTGVHVDLAARTATGEGEDVIVGAVHRVVGSSGDDVLVGGDGDDSLEGGGGSDRVEGRGGDDSLVGGDAVAGADGTLDPTLDPTGDVLRGGPGDDDLVGVQGDDRLLGGGGADSLDGGHGRDRLDGGPGTDWLTDAMVTGRGQRLDGGSGRDELGPLRLSGPLRGPDRTGLVHLPRQRVTVTSRAVRVGVTATGLEDVDVGHGRWTVVGTAGPNRLRGLHGNGPVTFRAGPGNDVVTGSFGRDLLDGGPGRDVLERTPGDDEARSFERSRRPRVWG